MQGSTFVFGGVIDSLGITSLEILLCAIAAALVVYIVLAIISELW